MAAKQEQEVLVVKKKVASDGHHGGAWKVAYADFVTAMMAFFLLLWLLNATTEDQKQGISNYFEPVGATKGSTGSSGALGGISATDPGPIEAPGQTTSKSVNVRRQVVTVKKEDVSQGDPSEIAKTPNRENLPKNTDEQRQFIAARSAVRRAMEQVPELRELFDSVAVEITEPGLLIRLMEHEKYALFDTGRTALNSNGKKLLKMISEVIERLPNKILITGYATPGDEASAESLSTWRISIERAYSGQRTLAVLGISDGRFAGVRGAADRNPFDPAQPNAAVNRRIELTLLRYKPQLAAKELIPPSVVHTP